MSDNTEQRQRATRLSVDQVRAIDHFIESLVIMFPTMVGVAMVGSSLERDNWRDVDLRIIVDDDYLPRLQGLLDPLDLHMLLSRWGQQVTGLPIDCQLQALSEHHRLMFGPNGEPRHNWRGKGRLGLIACSPAVPPQAPESETR